jgi:hypothetical protein
VPTARAFRVAIVAAVALGAAAAAILLNLALLGYAQPRNDPVGKLSPRATVLPGTTPATPTVTRPQDGSGEAERADD